MLFRRSIIIDHRLVSANDQTLDYDVELSIIHRNYVQIYNILYYYKKALAQNVLMSTIQNVGIRHIFIYIPNGVVAGIHLYP